MFVLVTRRLGSLLVPPGKGAGEVLIQIYDRRFFDLPQSKQGKGMNGFWYRFIMAKSAKQ